MGQAQYASKDWPHLSHCQLSLSVCSGSGNASGISYLDIKYSKLSIVGLRFSSGISWRWACCLVLLVKTLNLVKSNFAKLSMSGLLASWLSINNINAPARVDMR